MSVARSAASKVDWTRITQSLGLRGATATSLQSFKKRNDDARRRVQVLSEQPTEVDFSHYRSVLNNKAIVDEIEQAYKGYKVKTYDVQKQIKGIETFEAQAVKNAEETSKMVEGELRDLNETLQNMEKARPFDECTVDEMMKAEPAIEKKAEHMVKNHRWMPPGYKEKFGDLALL